MLDKFQRCQYHTFFSMVSFFLIIFLVVGTLTGCGTKKQLPTVTLSLWASPEDYDMIAQMVDEFKEEYKKEAIFNITISEEGEVSCKETVLANPQAAADVYTFAGDQFGELNNAGALLPITINTDKIIKDNGGVDSAAIQSASHDGTLYAYPAVASNGYFLYYNSEYYSEEDVKSLDKMLEIAAENGKKVSMDFSSGWYIYSFFKGAGLNVEMNADGITNSCNWNSTTTEYTGVEVTEAMLAIAMNDGFINCGDDDFVKGAQEGTIIAGINGAWNTKKIEAAYGSGFAAVKLPQYTLAGNLVQMHSFAGYKLVGVNAYTEEAKWAMRLAEWITNEDNQMTRFRERGEGPSNVNAAASPEVDAAPAIAALGEQAAYAHLQNVAGTFWTPAYVFGINIAAGNIDNTDLQELLDKMVEDITGPPVEDTETETDAE